MRRTGRRRNRSALRKADKLPGAMSSIANLPVSSVVSEYAAAGPADTTASRRTVAFFERLMRAAYHGSGDMVILSSGATFAVTGFCCGDPACDDCGASKKGSNSSVLAARASSGGASFTIGAGFSIGATECTDTAIAGFTGAPYMVSCSNARKPQQSHRPCRSRTRQAYCLPPAPGLPASLRMRFSNDPPLAASAISPRMGLRESRSARAEA